KPYTPGHRDLLQSARSAIRDHRGFGAATAADGYPDVGKNSVILSGVSRARVRDCCWSGSCSRYLPSASPTPLGMRDGSKSAVSGSTGWSATDSGTAAMAATK